jgi:hypothetical protein
MSEPSGRRLELWSKISAKVGEVRTLMSETSTDALAARCEAEGWPVAFVGCHLALGLHRQANWVRRVLAGSGPTAFDWERTHSLNALFVRKIARPERDDILAALDEGLARWRGLLDGASDDDLERIAFRQGENVRPIAWVAGVVAIRHLDEHMRSIKAALGY